MNKEHLFPQWLIRRARITRGITWAGKRNVGPFSATIPLCVECNSLFGTALEGPMSALFDDIEGGRGLSDKEADLLVRWLWKFEGLGWCTLHPQHHYSTLYTLRDRAMGAGFDRIRSDLTLAIGLAADDPGKKDLPLGLDSPIGGLNAIFVSGVFCRIAVMVVLDQFAAYIPKQFSKYELPVLPSDPDRKVFFPTVGFADGDEAIVVTREISSLLDVYHERFAQDRDALEKKLPNLRPHRVELPYGTWSSAPMFSARQVNRLPPLRPKRNRA